MIVITSPLGVVSVLALLYLTLLFSNLSRRLSSVTKAPFHQRWFIVAAGFEALAAMSQVVRASATLAPEQALPVLLEPWFAFVSYHLPLAVGSGLTLALVLRYWGWILKERFER